jgi:hypothetical protein
MLKKLLNKLTPQMTCSLCDQNIVDYEKGLELRELTMNKYVHFCSYGCLWNWLFKNRDEIINKENTTPT